MLPRGPLQGRALRPGRHGGRPGHERRYVTTTLPSGVARGSDRPLRQAGRSAPVVAITAGLVATASVPVGRLRKSRESSPASPHRANPRRMSPQSGPRPPIRTATAGPVGVSARRDRPPGDSDAGSRIRLLISSTGSPLGFVDLDPADPIPPPTSWPRRAPHSTSRRRSTPPGRSCSDEFAPTVSVVIATRGRSFELVRCVRSVLAIDYANFEVIVVDNNDHPVR